MLRNHSYIHSSTVLCDYSCNVLFNPQRACKARDTVVVPSVRSFLAPCEYRSQNIGTNWFTANVEKNI